MENTTRTFSELEKRLTDANTKLEFYASSLNGSNYDALLEREQELELMKQELELMKQELDELRRLQGNNNRIASDMGAQTSPSRDWAQASIEKLRELEQKLEESRQTNEQYKHILTEKEMEFRQLKEQVSRKIIHVVWFF